MLQQPLPDNFTGDNTEAFENHFIKINLVKSEDEEEMSRVDFITGCLIKTYYNPVFPLFVDFDESETFKLNYLNVGYLVAYDKKGRRKQCSGSIQFTFKNGAIKQC